MLGRFCIVHLSELNEAKRLGGAADLGDTGEDQDLGFSLDQDIDSS